MKEAGTYYILNTITGDRYDGSSVNIKQRWNNHRRRLNARTHDNPYLQNAWNKYGDDAFSFRRLDIMDGCSANEVRHKEQMLLDYKRATKNMGYNISFRADCASYKHSAVQNQQHSLVMQGNRCGAGNRGKRLSDVTKKQISSALKGRKLSVETKSKISTAKQGKKMSDEQRSQISTTLRGRKMSEETKTKISDALKGKPKSRSI